MNNEERIKQLGFTRTLARGMSDYQRVEPCGQWTHPDGRVLLRDVGGRFTARHNCFTGRPSTTVDKALQSLEAIATAKQFIESRENPKSVLAEVLVGVEEVPEVERPEIPQYIYEAMASEDYD